LDYYFSQSRTLFDLSQHDGELSALAAEIGIDWQKARDRICWDDDWKNNLPALDAKSRGKLSLISSVSGNTHTITFHSKRDNGISRSWTSKSSAPVDPLVISRNQLRAKKHKLKKEKLYAYLNQKYLGDWKSSYDTVDDTFPYLKAKKITGTGIGLRLVTETRRKRRNGQKFLAIPVFNQNLLVGLQRIYADGEKAFIPGTPMVGSYYKISQQKNPDDPIYICEGWATAWIIHLLTGCVVYCAFNAGNLIHVAEYLLKTHSHKNLIIAADNDQWKSHENAGLSKALDIHYKHRIKVRFPNFAGLELQGKKPTDFNDLFSIVGTSETRHQLTKARKSTLSVPTFALDYRLKKLSLSGVIKSASNKSLRRVVAAAFRKGYSDTRIKKLICGANSSVSELMVSKALGKIKYGHARRVAGCHTISPKAHPKAEFIDLPIVRQDHGGYLIHDEFYASIKDLKGIIVVKAPMGSGKTEAVIKKALETADKGSYQAHRISLVEESSRRLGIQSYRDVSKLEMSVTRKLGCCINSLNNPKFYDGDWFLDSDVLCIDEGTKVLSHLVGATVEQPEAVTDTLLTALNASRQVIICDADANDNLIEVLTRHTTQKIYVAQKNPKMDHVSVSIAKLEEAYEFTIEKALSGETVLCACDAKSDVERLKLALKKKDKKIRVLDIFSESKVRPEVEAWIKSPNEQSSRWDVVIYNSAVDSGVSVTTDHFKHQVGLFRGVITPDSVVQMMGRNRPARSWFIGCNPITPTRYGDDPGERFKALAAANLKVQHEGDSDLTTLPVASPYDQIRLSMEYADLISRQDYLVTLRLMLEQKGYKVEVKTSEASHLKAIRKEMGDLGKEIREAFIQLILSTATPQQLRYRQLKKAHAVSKEELAEIIRYEIRLGLGVSDIAEEDILFWLDNGERKDLMFEIMQSDRQQLFKYDHWQMKNSRSLTRNRHLLVKGDILHTLFSTIGIDRQTGTGSFTHEDCERFITYLQENKNRVRLWNYYHLGPHLAQDKRPRDPTKFVLGALLKLGLKTSSKLYGPKRRSRHEIDMESWDRMNHYAELRKKAGKHVASLPLEFQETEPLKSFSDTEHVEDHHQDYEGDSCFDCNEPLDAIAIKWAMDRCGSCRAQLLDPGG